MIQFANLGAAALLASLLFILLMHLFIRRPETQLVSSTMLYRDLAADVRRVQPRSRLRFSWLLVLQLLAALMLVAALMQPNLRGWSQRQQLVLVVDGSASMQAADVQPSRFRQAVEQAVARAEEARGAQIAVIWAGAEPEIRQGFTDDTNAVQQTLQALNPAADTGNMPAALALADSLLTGSPSGRIAVFSDASYPIEVVEYGHPVQWHVVGESTNNIGLVSLEAVRSRGNSFDLMARIANNTEVEQEIVVALRRADAELQNRQVQLPAGQTEAVFFTVQVQGRETLEVLLDLDDAWDDLALDNAAQITLGRDQRPRVLLLTEGNVFLERALLSYPEIRLFTRSEWDPEDETYDIVVVDGLEPPEGVTSGLFLRTLPAALLEPLQPQDAVGQLMVTRTNRTHPLARFLHFDGLRASRYTTIAHGSDLVPLVETEDRVVAAAGHTDGEPWVFLGLDLYHSNFPLSVDFPLFMGNALDWLHPEPVTADGVLSAVESDIRPRQPSGAVLTAAADDGSSDETPVAMVLWPWAAALAAIAVALEWFIFARRGYRVR